MRKVISLILDYFLTLIVGFAIGMFICIQYFDSINLVAGERFFVSKEIIVLGIFYTLPVLFLLLPFALVLYKTRHKNNPVLSCATFAVLSLLNWFIFYPVTLKLQNIAEKKFSENAGNPTFFKLNDLSSGYFRRANGKLYFFSKETESNSAEVIFLEDSAAPLDFAKEEKIDVSENSEFYKSSSPFRDPLVKETMTDIPYQVINVFHSIKFQAIRAWNYGFIPWICFCSLGFALCSLYSLIKLSSWRMINALTALVFTGLVIWFNDFYFSPLNNGMRNFLQSLFYESGKLNFFIDKGIEFPLMVINLLFGLIFTIAGIVIAIFRNREKGFKMKKRIRNFLINIAFCIFVFIICLVFGFFFAKIPELTSDSVAKFRFFSAIKLFCLVIPSVFAASASVAWCIEFGLHPENSRLRFSDAMFNRYKSVVINSLFFVLIITCAGEIFMPQIATQMKILEYKPKLMHEYQNSAKFFYENKNYETAFHFAKLAYEIDPKNKTNQEILFVTESHNDKKEEISDSIKKKINEMTFKDGNFDISEQKIKPAATPYKSFELMKTAKNCLLQKDWFGAHYYSQLALKSADKKDINISELKQISAEAWNKLNQAKELGTTEEQKIFAKKYEGYVSLINGDILHAYYVFHALSLESKKLSTDPDIVNYLEISEKLLKNQYFFRDETKNLQAYESANNVYFKIQENETKNSTIYFIHGITTSRSTTNMILYLRGLEIIELDKNGAVLCGHYVPYAKMTALQTEFLDGDTKNLLGIDKKITAVPYILLNSVDRNFPDKIISPEFKLGNKKSDLSGFRILKMPFSDFELIEQASSGADSMNLISLFNFVSKAEKYGYSAESFAHILMNRMLKPLYILILFVVIAYLAWHFRLEENSVFKFKWVAMFPLLCAAYFFLYNLAVCLFKFINYGLLGIAGVSFSLAAGAIVYVLIFVIVSVFFLSCRNSSGK